GSMGPFVYVVDEQNKTRIQAVKTGRVDGRRIEILSGVSVGEKAVTEGTDRLRDGATVVINEPGAPQRAGGAPEGGSGAPARSASAPSGEAASSTGAGAPAS